MTIESLFDNIFSEQDPSKPILIAGPCSAESEEQLFNTAQQLKTIGVNTFRAGIWKPRTRPNNFEGVGEIGLEWMSSVKKNLGLKTAVEVANGEHVEKALKWNMDILWIGARSSVNPFTVQEIADALKGANKPVLIKNPINPELGLWIGAIERVANAGIEQIAAIHRGFSTIQSDKYRNAPMWQIPLELKSTLPDIPILCDPSHIAGHRDYIFEVCQKAMDLSYNGIMVESHVAPDKALSDALQQVTPKRLDEIIKSLILRRGSSDNALFNSQLEMLRAKIDTLDQQIIDILAQRMKMVEEIGDFKKENAVTVFQLERWKEIIKTRPHWAILQNMDGEFVKEVYQLIHQESIKLQTEMLNKSTDLPD
ncbi:MAG: bifunctional 3-deoxy-7-phosphoheptulonate synthase/chorismate mutase type II [Bacteroidota bacterium]